MRIALYIFLLALLTNCSESYDSYHEPIVVNDSIGSAQPEDPMKAIKDSSASVPIVYTSPSKSIQTGSTTPEELLAFANSQIGVTYKYGSTNPAEGFDCSGFITYVFNHFSIAVPRSSVDFTNVQREVPLAEARPGDLILFTGTDSTIRTVGHMGILTSASNNEFAFIHSSSGKVYGVTITPLNKYYQGRFMKVIRIFPENNLH